MVILDVALKASIIMSFQCTYHLFVLSFYYYLLTLLLIIGIIIRCSNNISHFIQQSSSSNLLGKLKTSQNQTSLSYVLNLQYQQSYKHS